MKRRVADSGRKGRAFPAIRLGNAHLAHRLGTVPALQQLGLDRRPVLPQKVTQLGHAKAIDPGSTLVANDPLVGALHVQPFSDRFATYYGIG